MRSELKEYFSALDRLVQRGEKVTSASVSKEAGRKPGSIKPSRPVFDELRSAISAAAIDQRKAGRRMATQGPKVVGLESAEAGRVKELKRQLNASLERELNLIREVRLLRRKLSKEGNVVPLFNGAKEVE